MRLPLRSFANCTPALALPAPADPAEAARVPLQPSGLEADFEDGSFKGI